MDWKELIKPTKWKIILTVIFVLMPLAWFLGCGSIGLFCLPVMILTFPSVLFFLFLQMSYNSRNTIELTSIVILYVIASYILSIILISAHKAIKTKVKPQTLKIVYAGMGVSYVLVT